MTAANFIADLPPQAANGELPNFEVTYLDSAGQRVTHPLKSKNAANALRNFDKAVPRHGRILKVRRAAKNG